MDLRANNRTPPTIAQKFWANVEVCPGQCWRWLGPKTKAGYGHFYLGGVHYYGHRLSYELHKSSPPHGLLVCHICDNPECTNPDHLFVGTSTDNVRDMQSKGRGWQPRMVGESHPCAKLSAQDVDNIRSNLRSGETGVSLARKYGVSTSTIHGIKCGRSWRR